MRSVSHRGGTILWALALTALAGARSAHGAASLSVSSTTVANQGDSGQICVILNTGGEEVAGTQNDLVWDGSCATLSAGSNCYAAGTHGKGLSGKLLDARDFTYRALILSLSDVDPIDSGPLYCCAFQSEAAPGSCCNISIVGAGASDPRGKAIGANGSSGKICTAADSNSGRQGGPSLGQPLGGDGGGAGNGGAAPAPANPAPAGGGAAPAPAAQVLQGGGARPGGPAGDSVPTLSLPTLSLPTLGLPPLSLPTAAPTPVAPSGGAAALPPAAPAVALAPLATAAKALSPATLETTVAPTAAAPTAAPVAADTPTHAAVASTPTHARSTVAPTAAATKKADGGGWFGCQVGGGASPLPGLCVGALFALAARRSRRRTAARAAWRDDAAHPH